MFGGIQFRAIWGQEYQPDVIKLLEVISCMPPCLVHDDDVTMIAIFFREFLHEQRHYFGIAVGRQNGEYISVFWINRRIGIDVLSDDLSGDIRSLAFWCPAPYRNIDPAEAGFVLKEDLNWPFVARLEA
jgi:hypothetical protein